MMSHSMARGREGRQAGEAVAGVGAGTGATACAVSDEAKLVA